MKQEFDKLVATAVACLTLVLPGALSARERRGADVVITLKDGHYVTGELIAVKQDSLLIFAGKDESIDLVGIRSVRIVRKSKAGLGATCLGLAGALMGGISGAKDPLLGGTRLSIFAGILGAAAGGIVGLGAGALAGTDKTIQLEGKLESGERVRVLGYLRARARIRDYK